MMVEDGLGRVWIGSLEGLFVTNGTTVERFWSDPDDSLTISGRSVNWMALQGDSLLWLATENGPCAWNMAMRRAWRPDHAHMPAVLNTNHVELIGDAVWCSMGREMVRIRTTDRTITRFELPRSLFDDATVTSISAYPGRTDRVIVTTSVNVAEFLITDGRYVVYADPEGATRYGTVPAFVWNEWIWLGSWGQGLRRFKVDHGPAEHFRIMQMNGIMGGYTTSVWPKDDSTLWVPSEYGILEVSARTGHIRSRHAMLHPFEEIHDNAINALLRLRDGTSLAATDNGLARMSASPYAYSLIGFPDDGVLGLTPLWVMAMTHAPGSDDLLIGTYDGHGVMRQRDGAWEVIKAPRSSEDDRAVRVNGLLIASDGTVWMTTRDGPMMMGREGSEFRPLFPDQRFWTAGLYEDAKGRIWIGTGNSGVLIRDPRTKQDRWLKHDPDDPNSLISNSTIRAFGEDELGRMWIGTRHGLSVYDEAAERFLNFGADASEKQGFRTPFVYSIARDSRKRMWLSLASGGLCQVEVDRSGRMTMEVHDQRRGIDPDRTLFMQIDDQDRIWAVDKGVLMLDTRTGAYKHFGRADGLLDPPDGDSPLMVTSDGRLVIGISDQAELQVFGIDDLLRSPRPAPIEFLGIGTRNGDLLPGRNARSDARFMVAYADLPLYIEFSAIDLTRAHAHRYEYRMDGLDEGWRNIGVDRSLRFASLEPGDYVLHVRSAIGGSALDNERTIRFTIVPPWYRTAWARIAMVLIVATGILVLFRMKLHAVRMEEQRKSDFQKKLAEVEMHALRAQMNPHFLFNSLNSIKYYAMTKSPRETADYLGKFAMLIRRILQNSREDLVPLKDELEALRLYVEIESMRLEDKFDHVIRVAESIDTETVLVPPMLMQPYVENAIWHGLMNREDRGALSVDITEVDDELHVVIEDNGVGRKKAEELKNAQGQRERSFGMRITAERMELSAKTLGLGLRSRVDDLVDASGAAVGTRVILNIPIVHETFA